MATAQAEAPSRLIDSQVMSLSISLRFQITFSAHPRGFSLVQRILSMNMNNGSRRRGFTLIELLVVISSVRLIFSEFVVTSLISLTYSIAEARTISERLQKL
jgi:Prokaryotic N-terminal methylation motif